MIAGALAALTLAAAEPPPRLLAVGHSYVAGVNPDPAVPAWPDLVAPATGLALENHGIGGAQSPLIAHAFATRVTPRPADVVVIEAALNDVARRGRPGVARYRRALIRMVDHAAPARTLVALDPPIRRWDLDAPFDRGSDATLRAYNRVTRTVAAREAVQVIDLARGWDPGVHITTDDIHPTAAGTSLIARRVTRAIQMPK